MLSQCFSPTLQCILCDLPSTHVLCVNGWMHFRRGQPTKARLASVGKQKRGPLNGHYWLVINQVTSFQTCYGRFYTLISVRQCEINIPFTHMLKSWNIMLKLLYVKYSTVYKRKHISKIPIEWSIIILYSCFNPS